LLLLLLLLLLGLLLLLLVGLLLPLLAGRDRSVCIDFSPTDSSVVFSLVPSTFYLATIK